MTKEKTRNEGKKSFKFKSFFESLGMDDNLLESFKHPLINVVLDALSGPFRFVAEEKGIQDSLQKSVNEKNGLIVQVIFSFRGVLLTMLGFSLSIVGVVLTAESTNPTFFKSLFLLDFGLVLLAINILGSVVYIFTIHTVEANLLVAQVKLHQDTANQLLELIKEYRSSPLRSFNDYEKRKKEILDEVARKESLVRKNPLAIRGKDWYPHILAVIFLVGILFVGMAVWR